MTSRKTTSRKRKSTSKHKSERYVPDPLSRSALQMIDKASNLLKKSVIEGSKQTAKGRHAVKKQALNLLDIAARRLDRAIEQGSRVLRKSLRKI